MKPEAWSALFAGLAVLASLLGVYIAMRANSRADTANSHAKRSATAAEDSATEARRSADIAERSETRQTERNDVVWGCKLVEGVWTIINTGLDPAQDVVAIVAVDSQRFVEEAPAVAGRGGCLRVDFKKRWALSDAARRRLYGDELTRARPRPVEPMITTRVTWWTPAGSPKSYEAEPVQVSLEEPSDLRKLIEQLRDGR